MAELYMVRPSSTSADAVAYVYKTSACNTGVLGKLKKDSIVQVLKTTGNIAQIQWNNNGLTVAYMSMNDLKKSGNKGQRPSSSLETLTQQYTEQDNSDRVNTNYSDIGVANQNPNHFRDSMWKATWAFGAPPKMNMDIDIQYDDGTMPGTGRVFAKTLYSNPAILSICPGAVDFLPGFTKEEKDNFYESIKAMATNATVKGNIDNDNNRGTGKIYTFKSAYNSYCKVLNALCRACAVMLGIGDKNMPNTTIKLKEFDYGLWQMRGLARNFGGDDSIFKDFVDSAIGTAAGAVSDSMYMHYFITNSETSISESFSTGIEDSMIEDAINKSNISQLAKNLNYLFGGAIGDNTADEAFQFMQDNNLFAGDGFLSKIGKAATNYVQGGRMIIPKMLGDVQASKAVSCSMTFMSPYGDKLAVFLYCMVGVLSLISFSWPKQISENMYTYPFLVRAYQKGQMAIDLGVISDIVIKRGGQDETSWSQDGLATEWNVQFDIVPLYNEMMVTSTDHPLLFMKNDGLLEYLGNMCGIDLKANATSRKLEIAAQLLVSRFKEQPASLGRTIGEKVANSVNTLFQVG